MNRTRTGFSFALLTAVILLLFQMGPTALSQDQGYGQDQRDQGYGNGQDPPTRAGRLGFVQGVVSYQSGGQGDWLDALPNRPLTTGDNLWADKDGRAEVQIGATSIRLSSETSVTLLDLDDNVTQLRLSVGSVFFRVRHLHDGETFEVDTPNLAFNVYEPGEYRLDVNENGDQTTAIVWHGDAEITGGGNSYRLGEGQQGSFSGTDQLTYNVAEVRDNDDFDRWSLSRDEREDRGRSRQYVSDDVTGYEDLDEYGQWHNVEGYGNVWSPNGVAVGWAPYRFGHWAYVGPWGWTWVEEEPWGFAPFHYGRWAFAGGGWCWVPGPVAVAPVYSPALVAFIGGGFSVGVGGGVGWFPLAPGEVFVPWYRTSPRYVQNVNITNTRVTAVQVTNVYNNVTVNHVSNVTYVNQRVNNSVTVVNHDTFVNARPVRNNIIRVDQRQLAQARVTHDVARNIQPQRQSVMGAGRVVRQAPPAQVLSRPVVATRQPVIRNQAPPVAGFSRPVQPQVRTVHAAPPAQAQQLPRGARGGAPGGNNAGRPGADNAGRPAAPENNRGAAPRPGTPANAGAPSAPDNNSRGVAPRPGAPQNNNNNGARPGATGVPRPGAPENNPGTAPRPVDNARPGAPGNDRGMAPRPAAPENNPAAGRPNGPDNNPPSRNVPRPPSAQPERPTAPPEQQRGNPEMNRPDQQRGNPPNAQPERTRPETPRTMPEAPSRPENRPQPAPPPDNRRESSPQDQRHNAPPENRHQMTPPPENRQQQAPRPETRTEPAPRPEARPAEPPPQREARQPAPKPEKAPPEKSKEDKDKPPKSK